MDSEIKSTNPARGFELIGSVVRTSADCINSSVTKARSAFCRWKRISVEERCAYLDRFREYLEQNADAVAELQSMEMGKPIQESQQELVSAIRFLKNQTHKAAKLLAPRKLDSYESHQTEARYEPYGVAAVITPWNFPTGQFVANSAQILLAGNTVLLKHSEECVLTSQLLASLMQRAALPEGVFQVIYGDGEVGRELLQNDIDFIHFTGSSGVGKEVYKKAADKFVPATLEMGGASPAIVVDGIDVGQAARSIFHERFKNCGQICCALKRLYVQDSIFERVVEELIKIVRQQTVGDPLDEESTLGPLAAERQLDLLNHQVQRAVGLGAKVLEGGSRESRLDGAYFQPTIMTNISCDSPLLREEVFGPVLPVVPFDTIEQGIQLANDSPYGLSGFVYCNEQSTTERIVNGLEAGQISVNGASYFSNHAPFGGYKESGLGRVRGDEGYYDATQIKVVGRPAT